MVKVGFIVEGKCEKIIVESEQFIHFLKQNGFELVKPVIDAQGGGNLLPKNIEVHTEILKNKGVEEIYILTDLEERDSVDKVRELLKHHDVNFTFIAVKAIEAWFLADTEAMKKWLKLDEMQPENEPEQSGNQMPWDYLNCVAARFDARGTGSSKSIFAKRMVEHWGFSVEHAASHSNCASAKELVDYFKNKNIQAA